MSMKKFLKPASVLAAALATVSAADATEVPQFQEKFATLIEIVQSDAPTAKDLFIIERPETVVDGSSLAYHSSHSSHRSHSSHSSHSSHYSSSY